MAGLNNSSQPKYLERDDDLVRHAGRLGRLPGRHRAVFLAGSHGVSKIGVVNGLPVKPEPSTTVSHIVEHNASISFDVSRTGVPVVVTISYFPNWQASGATGPIRVSPNLMVVVPTSHHVSLSYGNTPVDYEGWGLSILGLVGLVSWCAGPSLRCGRCAGRAWCACPNGRSTPRSWATP